jgi:hypothetical protein
MSRFMPDSIWYITLASSYRSLHVVCEEDQVVSGEASAHGE